ncbi:MAG TPA: hypothetical protein VES01_05800 [Dermatophilaceae bacterium]|nr:hypothetical protein [Dermatophilaceae bacterium]
MSDLQCPATLLVLGSAGWPDSPAADVPGRVACIYTDPLRRAEAEALAVRFDAAPVRQGPVSFAGGGRLPTDLDEVADQHRGETVIVLPAGSQGTNRLVRIDADGWSVAAWA